ncbi:LicD family protein [Chryseobacterium sp. RP-3-3]|uniref:LicD family protein n=1 Tax=Chryseobacterium antibioticum TaxID=2728847 RepID=A0A7Y0AQ79_9FLAO|nr:LicD family protein [Chryseobacterium antibioticum]NML71485.1 LicD family protein [Chryseobacterium antibioticum]
MTEFVPDQIDDANSNILQVQSVVLRMLKVFSSICDRHKINYWLEYGTLLGSIRHKGFIPWDYEADVGMLREDFEKFLLVCDEIPSDIFFQTKDTDPEYLLFSVFVEAKFRHKYSCYVDETIKRFSSEENCFNRGISLDIFVYDLYNFEGTLCLFNGFEKNITGGKSYLKIEEIEELILQKFEDSSFFIPIGFDAYLKRNYDDYLILPPLHERRSPRFEIFNP